MSIIKIMLNSTLGLVLTLIMYSMFGSIVFMYLENENVNQQTSLDLTEKDLLEFIMKSEKLKDEKGLIKWSNLKEHLDQFQKEISKTPDTTTIDIWQSLYFCFTVYTTIGYGNIVPKTDAGRIFTALYALLGIPICLIALDRIGKFQIRILLWIHKKISMLFKTEKDPLTLPIYFLILIILSYMAIGNVIYKDRENWSTSESVYFMVVTFTTIGFGDILPEDSKYFMITIIYHFIGLSLMATLLNLIVAKLEESSSETTAFKDKSQ